jgi:hypothetical protein
MNDLDVVKHSQQRIGRFFEIVIIVKTVSSNANDLIDENFDGD